MVRFDATHSVRVLKADDQVASQQDQRVTAFVAFERDLRTPDAAWQVLEILDADEVAARAAAPHLSMATAPAQPAKK